MSYSPVLDALNTLSVKKLIHVYPGYPKGDYKSLCKKLYEDNGFEMVNFRGLDLETNAQARKLPMSEVYNLARKAYLETPQADAIYVDCGVWGGPPVVECLEEDFGKPVLIPASVFLWAGLKALKIRAPVKGFGQLFETLQGSVAGLGTMERLQKKGNTMS